MGFSWTSLSYGDIMKKESWSEIKDNIDTVINTQGFNDYSWSSAVVNEKVITKSAVQELRDATDYIDDQNYCSGHNNGYDSAYDGGDVATYHGDHESGYDNNRNYSAETSENTGYDYGDDSGNYSSRDSGANGAENGVRYYTHDGTYNSGDDGSHNGSYYDGYNSGEDSTYHTGHQTDYDGTFCHTEA